MSASINYRENVERESQLQNRIDIEPLENVNNHALKGISEEIHFDLSSKKQKRNWIIRQKLGF